MIKEFIGTGKTIQEATINARSGLNAPLGANIEVEVVCEPKKKILGLFGGSDAKVRASYNDGKKEKPAKKKQNSSSPKIQGAKKAAPAAPQNKKAEKPEPRFSNDKFAHPTVTAEEVDLDAACAYLKAMINGLNVENAQVSAEFVDGCVEMTIGADDYGIIIGRRGETLDALQYLTGLSIKNVIDKYVRVTINVGDYREKRAETLRALARKNAEYALRSGRRYTFEPMNPYERRIIHTAVQEIDGVESRSVGNGIDRRVVIEPEGGAKYQRPYRSDRRPRRNSQSSAPKDPNREKKVDRADIPKFGKIRVNNTDGE